MRAIRNDQMSIFERYAKHETGGQLRRMSMVLDEVPELLALVSEDLIQDGVAPTGRQSLPVESVLRCAVLKQWRQLSYRALAFYLEDSASYRSFARLPSRMDPTKSALQRNIRAIRPETWACINRALVGHAVTEALESTETLRVDSTVVASPIHDPTDGSLLNDGIRVLGRLMAQAKRLGAVIPSYRDERKRARRLARQLFYSRGRDNRRDLYERLLAVATRVLAAIREAQWQVKLLSPGQAGAQRWLAQAAHYPPLLRRVMDQARRRVFMGETVPAGEKLVSLFETHSDVIVKGQRDVQYGHKLTLTTGGKGLVLDAVIEQGNPADAKCFVPMLARHRQWFGASPTAIAADGGYASLANVQAAKACGVDEVAFHKKRGLKIEDMTSGKFIYQKLSDFRAGIEGNISELKRVFGLDRSQWKGEDGFGAYVWSGICCYNLVRLARMNTS